MSSNNTLITSHAQATIIDALNILSTYSLSKNLYFHILFIISKNPSNNINTPLHNAHKTLLKASCIHDCSAGETSKNDIN